MPSTRLVKRLEAAERLAPSVEETDAARLRQFLVALNDLLASLPPELREHIRGRTRGQFLRLIKGEPVESADPVWRALRALRQRAWDSVSGRYCGALVVRPEEFAAWERRAI